MANLTRYDPFSTNLDDLFKGMFLRPVRLDLEGSEVVQIKLNVTRSDGAYQVEAEMPGVKKEDIQVSVDGAMVTISGEVKKEKEEKKGDQVIRSERYIGRVERSFSLPQEIDEGSVNAKYTDGVLKLTLPLREKSKAKAIQIA
jgi:HSP20 family protein